MNMVCTFLGNVQRVWLHLRSGVCRVTGGLLSSCNIATFGKGYGARG